MGILIYTDETGPNQGHMWTSSWRDYSNFQDEIRLRLKLLYIVDKNERKRFKSAFETKQQLERALNQYPLLASIIMIHLTQARAKLDSIRLSSDDEHVLSLLKVNEDGRLKWRPHECQLILSCLKRVQNSGYKVGKHLIKGLEYCVANNTTARGS